MANSIKCAGEGLALQVTKPARSVGLVEENADGDATRLADVRVFSFDDLLLVVDLDRVDTAHVAELVASAARDTKSVYRAWDASLQISGGGYQVQLPPASDAGFDEGDTPMVRSLPGMLAIMKCDRDVARLVDDLETIRRDQVG